MSIELIRPAELPLTLGKWFWEHRDDLDHCALVETNDAFVVLRLDVDPPMDDDEGEFHRDGYVYVEIDGEALFAETSQQASAYSVPSSSDFRSGLRLARHEEEEDTRRLHRELTELRRFKQSAMSVFTVATLAVFLILFARACG